MFRWVFFYRMIDYIDIARNIHKHELCCNNIREVIFLWSRFSKKLIHSEIDNSSWKMVTMAGCLSQSNLPTTEVLIQTGPCEDVASDLR